MQGLRVEELGWCLSIEKFMDSLTFLLLMLLILLLSLVAIAVITSNLSLHDLVAKSKYRLCMLMLVLILHHGLWTCIISQFVLWNFRWWYICNYKVHEDALNFNLWDWKNVFDLALSIFEYCSCWAYYTFLLSCSNVSCFIIVTDHVTATLWISLKSQ